MVLYRIIAVGSTKFNQFQHCLFLLVAKAKNYISITSTFTDYKSERISKQNRLFIASSVLRTTDKSITQNIANANSSYDHTKIDFSP